MDASIQVLIVDDHAIVREGQRALIDTEPGMTVVGEAKDGVEAVEMAHALHPDVILLDLLMPRKDGIAACGDAQQVPDRRIGSVLSILYILSIPLCLCGEIQEH